MTRKRAPASQNPSKPKKRTAALSLTTVLRHATVPLVAAAAILTIRDASMPQHSVRATVRGVPISISLSLENPNHAGVARYQIPAPLPCPISLAFDPDVYDSMRTRNTLAYVLAHEIGHCLDYRVLNGSHGHISAPLGEERNQDVAEAEAYAEAYAAAYLRDCGNLLSPLGWPSATPDGTCPLPDPTTVVEQSVAAAGHPGEHVTGEKEVQGGQHGTVLATD